MSLSETTANLIMLGTGVIGAFTFFISDLILYYPMPAKPGCQRACRSAKSYFNKIDPGGSNLAQSTMHDISSERVMCGGAIGPFAAVFYSIGYAALFFGLQDPNEPSSLALPIIAAVGFSLFMTIGSSYHAIFAYTCFISKEIAKKESSDAEQSLVRVLAMHQNYLKYLYRLAAVTGVIGNAAFIYCCLTRNTLYTPWTILFSPAFSAPIKKYLKRKNLGTIVLAGGLTNLWNSVFFAALIISVWQHR